MNQLLFPVFAALILVSAASHAGVESRPVARGDRHYVDRNEQCVIYARRFAPNLPRGLNTKADKQRIINTSKPKAGRVAIMSLGPVWHVGVVTDVDDQGKKRHLEIVEHNVPEGASRPRYRKASCSDIDDCERQLKIVGYFKP